MNNFIFFKKFSCNESNFFQLYSSYKLISATKLVLTQIYSRNKSIPAYEVVFLPRVTFGRFDSQYKFPHGFIRR